MWYAPIGSLEYTINLHNDILIKKYILSEQRLKQQTRLALATQNLYLKDKKDIKKNKPELDKSSESKLSADSRLNRIKGCAVDVKINRSFKKTSLDVVTYDSTFKK